LEQLPISAISTFISGLKSAGLWNKLQVIYPFVGTTTGSQTINLKEPGLYRLGLTGSFSASNAGLYPSSSTSFVDSIPGTTVHPLVNSASAHLSLLSYDLPTGNGFLGGNSAPAVGGQIIARSGSKVYHAFTVVGTSSFVPLTNAISNVEVMVVAGGGGGGSLGGGGGAGGLIYSSSFAITPGSSVQVVVGNGGAGGAQNGFGSNGENSSFSSIQSLGGGGAGSYAGSGGTPGQNGGSGGGGGATESGLSTVGGSGSIGQGNNGGSGGYFNNPGGGGGGGAGQAGQAGGLGGSGSYYPQFDLIGGFPAGWFAGGGNGVKNATQLASAPGGGGASTTYPIAGTVGKDAVANTGGGGGNGSYTALGGRGGSGIVIVGYDVSSISATTGSGTGLYLTDTAVTGSVNSQFTSGITGSGNIGLLTVSRTGSGTFSIHKNNVSQSFASASLGALSSDIFFNTANLAGSGSLPLQANLSYASIGAGLTTSEVATYTNLISQLQTNLKRKNTLLDNYTGAAAAYSLRRIGPSGYFGPAIKVRRDSDNTLRDIGFTSDGQLDTVGLLDFVGVTGSGFVQTWYDQSGNNKHGIGGSPIIVSSGSIFTDGIKPALRFRGSVAGFTDSFNTGLSISQPFSYITSYRNSETGYYSVVFNGGNNNSNWLYTPSGTTSVMWAGNSNVNTPLSHDLEIAYGEFNLANTTFYINNTLKSSGNPGTENTPNMYIGGGNFQLKGTMQELHFYTGSVNSVRTDLNNNLNSYYKIYGSATASFDPDYSAFITATGITQPTQSAALETLVLDLKSYGLWSKMKAIYPMVTDKNNRFAYSQELNTEWNPVNTVVTANNVTAPDGTLTAERITETTSSITTYTVTNNGASAYTINGSDNPVLTLERGKTYQFNINASGHPFYIMTGSGAYTAGGQYDTGVTGQGTQVGTLTFVVPDAAPSTLAYVCQFHSSMGNTINVINNTDSHHIYQTISDGLVTGSEYVASIYGKFLNRPWIAVETNAGAKAWFNIQTGVTGSLTGSNATITAVSGGWYRCALYFTSSVASGPKNIEYHLADTNGNLTYAGVLGTGSYLWGAQFENGNLVGPYRATTTVGFTTGSMLDQMKYNLKNTASFSGSYVGGWTPSYTGNKPNGSTGYMNTSFNPSAQLTTGSHSITYYSRTESTGSFTEIGAYVNGTSTIYLQLKWTDNKLYASSLQEGLSIGITLPNSSSRGFYQLSRTANNVLKVYKDSSIFGTNTLTNTGTLPNSNILIGGELTTNYSNRESAFASIGDGLTDYEAKALYWIVQKYQTTLGRQVY
jgi:hypothetical protein